MTYTYIVNPETGEILFDLVHDLITQNIRAIKLIAKKLNAVLRQKGEIYGNGKEVITVNVNIENIDKLKDLSTKLAGQCEQVSKTINEINDLELEITV